MLVSNEISNFLNVACQKSDRNLRSRLNIITDDISQFACCSLSIRAWAHFFVDQIDLSEISISLLKNLLMMISRHFKSFMLIDNARIKSSVIVWKKMFADLIEIISSYDWCYLIWYSWHFKQWLMNFRSLKASFRTYMILMIRW